MPDRIDPSRVALEPRPGLAKTNPEKVARRDHRNAWFIEWCRRNGVTERDLAERWGLAKTVVHEIFARRRSIHWEDLDALPHRIRVALAAEYMADISKLDFDSHLKASGHR